MQLHVKKQLRLARTVGATAREESHRVRSQTSTEYTRMASPIECSLALSSTLSLAITSLFHESRLPPRTQPPQQPDCQCEGSLPLVSVAEQHTWSGKSALWPTWLTCLPPSHALCHTLDPFYLCSFPFKADQWPQRIWRNCACRHRMSSYLIRLKLSLNQPIRAAMDTLCDICIIS